METGQRKTKGHTSNSTSGYTEGCLKATAVDPLSPYFEETFGEPPAVAATLVVPLATAAPSGDDELQQEEQMNAGRPWWCRPLYLAVLVILAVGVFTAGAIIVAHFVVSAPKSTSPPSEAPSSNLQLRYHLSLGNGHTCSVTNQNVLMCWGWNGSGQVGDGTMFDRSIPTPIDLGLNIYAQQIALGEWHTCVITNKNQLKCWGHNYYGQVGDGTTYNRNLPTSIDLGLNVHADQIALGGRHTCAITNNNELKCWGYNKYGQIGDGTTTSRSNPTSIDLGLNEYAQKIALGSWHTCSVTNENKLMCWGLNSFGQLGDGTTTNRSIPTSIDLGLNVYARQISLGDYHTCIITNANKLMCWGQNWYGQVGDGTTGNANNRSVPTTIDLGLNINARQIALGQSHTCAVTNENQFMCWGYNWHGQLGDGTTTNRSIPTMIDVALNVYAAQIALGWDHTCAVTNENELKCWGHNIYGQVGDGTNTDRSTPTLIW